MIEENNFYNKYYIEDINCIEPFINVSFENKFGITEDDINTGNIFIYSSNGRQVGKVTDLDDDYIYGILYSPSHLLDLCYCELNKGEE